MKWKNMLKKKEIFIIHQSTLKNLFFCIIFFWSVLFTDETHGSQDWLKPRQLSSTFMQTVILVNNGYFSHEYNGHFAKKTVILVITKFSSLLINQFLDLRWKYVCHRNTQLSNPADEIHINKSPAHRKFHFSMNRKISNHF